MNRIHIWTAVAALALAGAAGCQSPDAPGNVPPGENGTRAGGNGAFGSDVAQPGEGTHGMNGTDTNSPPANGTR